MIAQLCILLLKTIRPILGPASCKFYPSCTEFACQQLENERLHKALFAIMQRVFSCF